jgi:transglutaminase-like putative cysteine protease
MTYEIVHQTLYEYSESVTISHHAARLEPKVLPHQHSISFDLEIHPAPALRKLRHDYFNNRVCFFSIQEMHPRLAITARSQVTVAPATPPDLSLSPPWESVAALFRHPVSPEVVAPYEFAFDSPHVEAMPELGEYARASFLPGAPLLAAALDVSKRIYRDFKYDAVATTVSTPLSEVLEKRCGVCQDFAHLAIGCLRSLGLPARYVSGYLRTHPAPGQERLAGADASHAWFSIFCPSVGWVDFDPTNNMIPGEEHITVAYGRDFGDVSPVSGILVGGGRHEVSVAVDVAVAGDGHTPGRARLGRSDAR